MMEKSLVKPPNGAPVGLYAHSLEGIACQVCRSPTVLPCTREPPAGVEEREGRGAACLPCMKPIPSPPQIIHFHVLGLRRKKPTVLFWRECCYTQYSDVALT